MEVLQGQPLAGGGAPIKGVAKLYRRVLASDPQNVLRTRVPPPLTLRYPSPGCAVTRLAMSAQETAHIFLFWKMAMSANPHFSFPMNRQVDPPLGHNNARIDTCVLTK